MMESTRARLYAVLQTVALQRKCTRQELAQRMGLDKNVVNASVNVLLNGGYLVETELLNGKIRSGRKAMNLEISPDAPVVGGMLIQRGFFAVCIGNISGEILQYKEYTFETIRQTEFVEILCHMFSSLRDKCANPILAIGISSCGPVDRERQTISPPYFYDITDFPLAKLVEEKTGIPTMLMNDVNAGALAEKMYGNGRQLSNYIFLHITKGIGAGIVMDNQIYYGPHGKCGELGHTSIRYDGPLCECGNRGCLELYANIGCINQTMRRLRQDLQLQTTLDAVLDRGEEVSFSSFINACNHKDTVPLLALDEFCTYLASALINIIRIMDINTVIIGYNSMSGSAALEDILYNKCKRVLGGDIRFIRSFYYDKAPLYGSIAMVNACIYAGSYPYLAALETNDK